MIAIICELETTDGCKGELDGVWGGAREGPGRWGESFYR